MKKFFVLACFSVFASSVFSQNAIELTASLEWSLYQRYQRPNNTPFAKVSNQHNSAGQVLNVVPNLRAGISYSLIDYYSYIYRIGLDGGIQFHPYSIDSDAPKGNGAWSFPIMLTWNIVGSEQNYVFGISAGVQFSQMEIFGNKNNPYGKLSNPFFMTYCVEVSYGLDDTYLIDTASFTLYARLGLHQHNTQTLDVGVRCQFRGAVYVEKDKNY